jgi:citrate lyase subunit beta/citryl-CoA lyase
MALPRTYLFVPGDRPERFAKALASGADAVVIDLEDAVSAAGKVAARDTVRQFFEAADAATRARIVIRINDEATTWYAGDLAMLHGSHAGQVMLPKTEKAETVGHLCARCPGIAVLALVETARGVLAAEAIAIAPGVQRLVFGTVDYALDLGLSGDPLGLDHAASRLALASRAAGIAPPVAGVTVAVDDESQLLADLARAQAHGFAAKLCIHPRQVAAIHAALAPSTEELAWARRLMDWVAAKEAAGQGAGAAQLDGRMIDKPVIESARRVIERAAR